MKNKITNLFLALMVLTLTFGTAEFAQAAGTQRVMIEDFTGTWCGWCPGGRTDMEDAVANYGTDKVIPIAVHNNDPMSTVFESRLGSFFGVNGYPSAFINRLPITQQDQNGNKYQALSLSANPGAYDGKGGVWGNIAGQVLPNSPSADIDVTYFIDSKTRVITVNVTATILADIKFQTAFNAIVIEDKVTGTASNWKQNNYFPSYPQYSNNPNYKKPSQFATDYNDVLRDYLGSELGETFGLPATLKAGETYRRVFSKLLPATVNIANVKVIGYMSYYDMTNNLNNSVINCNYGTPVAATLNVVGSGNSMFVAPVTAATEKSWVCTNYGINPIDFKLTMTTSQRTPSDWKFQIENPNLTVQGGSSANCKVIVTPGTTMGIGDAIVTVTPSVGEPYQFKITVASKEIERINVNYSTNSNNSDLTADLENFDEYKGFITLNRDESRNLLTSFPNLKMVIANTGSLTADFDTYMQYDFDEANRLASLFNTKKVKLFVTGSLTMQNMLLNNVSNNLATTFGITATSANIIKVQTFNVSGVSGDPISNGFKVPAVPQYGGFYPLTYSQTAGSKSTVFLSMDNQAQGAIGFRMENATNGARAVILSQDLNSYDVTNKTVLLKKIMDWIFGNVPVETPAPIATVNTNKFDFGTNVEYNKPYEKTLTVSNTGTANLVIQEPTFAFGTDLAFTDGNTYPITLAKGVQTTMKVTWTPKKANKFYTDYFTFATNDKDNLEIKVDISGKTAVVGSVEDGIEGVFTAKLSSNPIYDNTQINFTVGGATEQNVNIKLIDASGAVISELTNTNYAPGNYNIGLNVANLASGSYFVLANAAGIQAKLTAIVVK